MSLEAELRRVVAELVREEVERRLGARDADGYLSISAAARLTGYATRTISRWIKEGRVAAVGAGRTARIRRSDLERALLAPRSRPVEDNSDPIAAARRDLARRNRPGAHR